MDRAFEAIINVAFNFVMFCIVLGLVGLNPLVLFASVSGFVLGFSFMVSFSSRSVHHIRLLDVPI
jgi:hypothetical protein